MFEAVNPATLFLSNAISGFFLGVILYIVLLYLLSYLIGPVDAGLVMFIGAAIVFLLFIFGFDSYMQSLIHTKVDGLQGAMNKFVEFLSSALFLAGAAAGFGGAYKLNR